MRTANLLSGDNRAVLPMIRSSSLRGFGALVDQLGGDAVSLLRRFGIEEQLLQDDDGLISITAHDLMLDAAARELACPDFGLRLAQSQDLTILGPLAVAIEACSTVAQALDCASRFMFVHSPALKVTAEEDPLGRPGVLALTYRKDLRESTYSPQGIELGLGVLYRIAVSLTAGTALRSVLVSHPPVSSVDRYVEYFGVDVRFTADVAALCVQSRVLNETFAGANAALLAMAVDHIEQHFTDPRDNVTAQVRLAIAELLRTARPTLATTARLLTLHPRALQRALAAEQTTFADLLDDVRREAARRYLTTTTLPVGQIANMVGFAEQSTLTHATQRWFGVSPREVRQGAASG